MFYSHDTYECNNIYQNVVYKWSETQQNEQTSQIYSDHEIIKIVTEWKTCNRKSKPLYENQITRNGFSIYNKNMTSHVTI